MLKRCDVWNHHDLNAAVFCCLCRWLKVQSHLKTCHENLQLALEVSSFYQQAENTMSAINNMVKVGLAASALLAARSHSLPFISSRVRLLL